MGNTHCTGSRSPPSGSSSKCCRSSCSSTRTAAKLKELDASAEPLLLVDRVEFVVDAAKNGCSGMFYRTAPRMDAKVSTRDWPRNGTRLHGWVSKTHPGWIRVDDARGREHWLPLQQSGRQVCHVVVDAPPRYEDLPPQYTRTEAEAAPQTASQ